jgi:hypothetical protein
VAMENPATKNTAGHYLSNLFILNRLKCVVAPFLK